MARKEARNLTASWLNIVAASVISVGVVGPVAALLVGGGTASSAGTVAIVSLGFLALGTILHLSARAMIET